MRLDDVALFVRSAALGGFSGAAREVDLLPGQVSVAIRRLERELDVRLFARSTRSLRLTAEGERWLPHAQAMLDSLQQGRDELRGQAGEPTGVLQLAAPSDLGRNVLLPWLAEFARRHPRLSLRLHFSDRVSDVFREPVDVAVRYAPAADASFVALPLAPDNRRVLVASPAYLAAHGAPASLDDVAGREALRYALGGRTHEQWVFLDAGRRRTVSARGALQADDGDAVRRLALAGEGIAYKSWLDVAADVEAGRLVQLLAHLQGEPAPLALVCPHRRQFSPAVQGLHALLRERCAAIESRQPAPAAVR